MPTRLLDTRKNVPPAGRVELEGAGRLLCRRRALAEIAGGPTCLRRRVKAEEFMPRIEGCLPP